MSCKYCTDPDGDPCFPIYGLAPHIHGETQGRISGTFFLPREQWPSNFREDPAGSNRGTWWCPMCGAGKPEQPTEETP